MCHVLSCRCKLFLTAVSSSVQRLRSLILLDAREGQGYTRSEYTVTPAHMQSPEALPPLQFLQFTSYHAWDALHRALWPLVLQAAQAASEGAALLLLLLLLL